MSHPKLGLSNGTRLVLLPLLALSGCASPTKTYVYSKTPGAPKVCVDDWMSHAAFADCRRAQKAAEDKIIQAKLEKEREAKRRIEEAEEKKRLAAEEKARQIREAEEERERIKAEREEKERLAKEERERKALEIATLKAARPNTHIDVYKKYYGEPTSQEIVNGDDVLWYDDYEKPMFVVFRNSKLISRFIDRQTIKDRAEATEQRREEDRRIASEQADAQRRQAEADAERRRQLIESVGRGLQDAFNPKTVNCHSTPNFAGGYDVQCR